MIVDMIIKALIEKLTQDNFVEVPEDDLSRANEILDGKLQEDPESVVVAFSVYPNWPHAENQRDWAHVVDDTQHEMPGAFAFKRRFSVQLIFFYTTQGLTRAQALTLAHTGLGRAEQSLMDATGLTALMVNESGEQSQEDEFGEKLEEPCRPVRSSWLRGGGGEGEWNYKGWILLEYETRKYT